MLLENCSGLPLKKSVKNHNTVAVGGHPNPTYLHHAVILPAAGSRIVGLSRRNSHGGDGETHSVGQRRNAQQGGTEKRTAGGGRRNAQGGDGETHNIVC